MEAACVNHPDSNAIADCTACRKSVCLMCLVEENEGSFCSLRCVRVLRGEIEEGGDSASTGEWLDSPQAMPPPEEPPPAPPPPPKKELPPVPSFPVAREPGTRGAAATPLGPYLAIGVGILIAVGLGFFGVQALLGGFDKPPVADAPASGTPQSPEPGPVAEPPATPDPVPAPEAPAPRVPETPGPVAEPPGRPEPPKPAPAAEEPVIPAPRLAPGAAGPPAAPAKPPPPEPDLAVVTPRPARTAPAPPAPSPDPDPVEAGMKRAASLIRTATPAYQDVILTDPLPEDPGQLRELLAKAVRVELLLGDARRIYEELLTRVSRPERIRERIGKLDGLLETIRPVVAGIRKKLG